MKFDNREITITCSGGVANASESSNSSDLVNKADERLYVAKTSGRDIFITQDK